MSTKSSACLTALHHTTCNYTTLWTLCYSIKFYGFSHYVERKMRKNLSYIKGITYSLWSMNLWTLQSPQQLLLGDREEHQQGLEKVLWRPDVFQQVLRRAVFKFCSTHPRAKLSPSRSLTCPHRCCWKSLSASCLPFLSSGLTSPSCITMSELLYLPATLPLPHSPPKN